MIIGLCTRFQRPGILGNLWFHHTDYDTKKILKKKLREETIKIWQNRWNVSIYSRKLYSWIPDITEIINNKWFKPNYATVQLITGHGNISDYYNRFHLRVTTGCRKCHSHEETNGHLLFYCPALQELRDRLYIKTGIDITRFTIRHYLTNKEYFKEFQKYCTNIMKLDSSRPPPRG